MAAGYFSAVQHFLLYGQREARAISPFIDLGKYLSAFPPRLPAARRVGVNANHTELGFGGSATGDITLRINEDQTHLTFSRG